MNLPISSNLHQLPFFSSATTIPQRHHLNPNQHQSNLPTLEETKQLHSHMIKTHFNFTLHNQTHLNIPLSSSAQHNYLITCYTKNNDPLTGFQIYKQMRQTDTEVDSFTVPSVIKACGNMLMVCAGKEVHGFALKVGLGGDVFVCNGLILMYSECGSVLCARNIFDEMPHRDVVSWSTMIRGFHRNGLLDYGLSFIREMQFDRVKFSESAMISIVKLIGELADLKMAKAVHAFVVRNAENEAVGLNLATCLIDMYTKSANLEYATNIFMRLSQKNIVLWTVMIAGHIHCNELEKSVKLFVRMLEEGFYPNKITILSMIRAYACASSVAKQFGSWLHGYILRTGCVSVESLSLSTSLVAMYAKYGQVSYAQRLFDRVENKDVMIWSSMISCYAQNCYFDKAFSLFNQMRESLVMPNHVTVVSLVSLCAEAGALEMGKWVHFYVDKQGLKMDLVLKTAFVDMYCKCGDIVNAYKLFIEAKKRDIYMWNAMIVGFGIHGCGIEALEIYSCMKKSGTNPNDVTFIGLLHACSHARLVEQGKQVFYEMVCVYEFVPRIEHYGCMVDLLGRAGFLQEAFEMIKNMPISPNTIIWGALLSACQIHKNWSLGEIAARELFDMEPQNCGYNALMANIFAEENRWNDVATVRKAMKDSGIKKEPGRSWIEVNGSVHAFKMGDRSHPEIGKIDETLGFMMERATYVTTMTTDIT